MSIARILAIDDEVRILDIVESYLVHSDYHVQRAISGREGLERFSLYKPDLVILDLMLPDISGEEVCATIRRQSKVPVLMLTAKSGEDSVLTGFNRGADDYLIKPFSPRELVMRVGAILRRTGNSLQVESILESSDHLLILDTKNCRLSFQGKILEPTATELRLLQIFMKNPGRVFSREDLARLVLGDDFEGDLRTIDAHIKNVRHKIGDDPRAPRYIHTVHGLGYRFGAM